MPTRSEGGTRCWPGRGEAARTSCDPTGHGRVGPGHTDLPSGPACVQAQRAHGGFLCESHAEKWVKCPSSARTDSVRPHHWQQRGRGKEGVLTAAGTPEQNGLRDERESQRPPPGIRPSEMSREGICAVRKWIVIVAGWEGATKEAHGDGSVSSAGDESVRKLIVLMVV